VDVRGWDYITEYDLVASDVDAARIIYTDNPTEKWLQELRKQNRGFKGSQTDDEAHFGDWMTGFTPQLTSGAVAPTDANEGDRWYDSTNKIEYEYKGGVWVNLALGSGSLSLPLHIIEGLVLTNNNPGPGSISWAAFSITYNGTTYAVNAGNTANSYAWWDFSTSTAVLQTTNAQPTITADDRFIALNVLGLAFESWTQGFVHGGELISTSVAAAQIVANTITANEMAANTITANEIFAGTITATEIAAHTITANEITAGTITADEIHADAITTDKVIANAISIGKLNTNIATESFSPLYTTFEEYTRNATDVAEDDGVVIYTRTEWAEPKMRFKLKETFGEVKEAGSGTYFLDTYFYGTVDTSGIFEQNEYWDVALTGAGALQWTRIKDAVAGIAYRIAGGSVGVAVYQSRSETAAGAFAGHNLYQTYASIDITAYNKLVLTFGAIANAAVFDIRIETDAANYYELANVDCSTTYSTYQFLLSGFTEVGTPDPADINTLRLIPTDDTIANFYAGNSWFTKCLIDAFDFSGAAYQDYDSGELDELLTTGEDAHLRLYLGQGNRQGATPNAIYLNYPASKIYNVGYVEEVL